MAKKEGEGRFSRFGKRLLQEIRKDKGSFFVFAALWIAIVGVMIQGGLSKQADRVFAGGLCLLLLLVPPLVECTFSLQLPTTLEICAYLFVFCAGVLGEIRNFYQRFPAWDSILHAANGFLFAGFGFSLFSLFEKKRKVRTLPSPAYQSFTAFCFSMTVGVFWEFFEYAADHFLHTDMQKDGYMRHIGSVLLAGEDGALVRIENISGVVIETADGGVFRLPAYLDVGLSDTMKDLAVNLVGAFAFCVIGYWYLKRRRITLAAQFIPRVRDECD